MREPDSNASILFLFIASTPVQQSFQVLFFECVQNLTLAADYVARLDSQLEPTFALALPVHLSPMWPAASVAAPRRASRPAHAAQLAAQCALGGAR